jgi:NAD(P)H-dependent FMN reductase
MTQSDNNNKPRLGVLICSTRPGRAGEPIAHWFVERARRHAAFEVVIEDLKERNLPALDEPKHPRLRDYVHEHTKAWSAAVSSYDAYAIVTPEYNNGSAPALINALNFLYQEWNYKPACFVTYGGVSGGTRSLVMTRTILNTLKVVPVVEAVSIPFFNQHVKDGVFSPPDSQEQAIKPMLDETLRWSNALKTLRS